MTPIHENQPDPAPTAVNLDAATPEAPPVVHAEYPPDPATAAEALGTPHSALPTPDSAAFERGVAESAAMAALFRGAAAMARIAEGKFVCEFEELANKLLLENQSLRKQLAEACTSSDRLKEDMEVLLGADTRAGECNRRLYGLQEQLRKKNAEKARLDEELKETTARLNKSDTCAAALGLALEIANAERAGNDGLRNDVDRKQFSELGEAHGAEMSAALENLRLLQEDSVHLREENAQVRESLAIARKSEAELISRFRILHDELVGQSNLVQAARLIVEQHQGALRSACGFTRFPDTNTKG